MSTRPAAIQLHIEELILHGGDPADRHRIGDAVQRELTRLLAAGALPPAIRAGGDIPSLDGGSRRLAASSNGTAIGNQIARAVHEGLGQ
jgi:hypothetical protein